MKGLISRPDSRIFELRDFGAPLHETLREAIGGYIEVIHPRGLEPPMVMIGDEEALLKEKPHLNLFGSLLYGTMQHGHPICGTVVFMAEGFNEDGEPDIVGLTDEQIQALLTRFNAIAFAT